MVKTVPVSKAKHVKDSKDSELVKAATDMLLKAKGELKSGNALFAIKLGSAAMMLAYDASDSKLEAAAKAFVARAREQGKATDKWSSAEEDKYFALRKKHQAQLEKERPGNSTNKLRAHESAMKAMGAKVEPYRVANDEADEVLPVKLRGKDAKEPHWMSPDTKKLSGLHHELTSMGYKHASSASRGKGEVAHKYTAPGTPGVYLLERAKGQHAVVKAEDKARVRPV
jgi:hypothetical protein